MVRINRQYGSGLSVKKMNVYNPKRIKLTIGDVKEIMDSKSYLVFHITGDVSKLKKHFNSLVFDYDKEDHNLTDGFYWYDMPIYKEDPNMLYPKLYVGFLDQEDKKDLLNKLGIKMTNLRFVHYPKPIQNKNDTQQYKITYKINPKYPIYIISKGRWKNRLTVKAMEEADIPYKIVVEPQEYDNYAEVIDEKNILILPNKYLNKNQGGIPARNFVWEHAVSSGAKKHWILDDNIDGFYRWNYSHRWKIKSGVLLKLCEDYVSRFSNILQSGMNYRMFYPNRQSKSPVVYNTRIYSCILNDHRWEGERWRGRYNEDTDLSLRILKSGYATCLFNAFLCGKAATLTSSGGNTDTIYDKGAKQALFDKADSLRKQHPDVARIVNRYNRGIHHEVNYSKFEKNNLGYKNPKINKGSNEYNMKLVRKSNQ